MKEPGTCVGCKVVNSNRAAHGDRTGEQTHEERRVQARVHARATVRKLYCQQ